MQKTNSPPCENSFLDNEDDEFQQTMVRQETFSYQQTPVDFLQTLQHSISYFECKDTSTDESDQSCTNIAHADLAKKLAKQQQQFKQVVVQYESLKQKYFKIQNQLSSSKQLNNKMRSEDKDYQKVIDDLNHKVYLFQQLYEKEKNQKEYFEQAYQKQMLKEIDYMNYQKKQNKRQHHIDYDMTEIKHKLNTMPNEMQMIDNQAMQMMDNYSDNVSQEYAQQQQFRPNSRNMQQNNNLNFYTDEQIQETHITNSNDSKRRMKQQMIQVNQNGAVHNKYHTRQPSGISTPIQQQHQMIMMPKQAKSPFVNPRATGHESFSRNQRTLSMSRSLNTTGNQNTPYQMHGHSNHGQAILVTGNFIQPSVQSQSDELNQDVEFLNNYNLEYLQNQQ